MLFFNRFISGFYIEEDKSAEKSADYRRLKNLLQKKD